MTTDQLRARIAARPFVPFVIHMADGRSAEVRHPEWVAYAGGRVGVVMKPDETFEVVDLLLVPSLETVGRPSSS